MAWLIDILRTRAGQIASVGIAAALVIAFMRIRLSSCEAGRDAAKAEAGKYRLLSDQLQASVKAQNDAIAKMRADADAAERSARAAAKRSADAARSIVGDLDDAALNEWSRGIR